jgi:hypothetical protein
MNNSEIMKNIVIFFLLFIILLSSFSLLYNFSTNTLAQYLSVNKPINDAEVLLVEGWVPKKLLGYVKEEFYKSSYKYILVSSMDGEYVSEHDRGQGIYSDTINVAHELVNMGIDSSKIKIVSCPSTEIHRTFSMALAARKWVNVNDPMIRYINVFTTQNHGRKTWCSYQKVFGDSIKVGIITYPKRKLPVSQWWFTRSGVRYQLYSLAGYIYVKLWPVALLEDNSKG